MCARTKQPARKKVPTGPLKTITKPTDDIETKFPDRLKFLTNMGFDERQAQAALEKTDYDVQKAAKLLKSGQMKLKKPKKEENIEDDEDDTEEAEPMGQGLTETIGERADADKIPTGSLSAGIADTVPFPKPNSETSPKETDPEEREPKEKKNAKKKKQFCIVEGFSDSDTPENDDFVLESPINPPPFENVVIEISSTSEEDVTDTAEQDKEREKEALIKKGIIKLTEDETNRLLELYGVSTEQIPYLTKPQKRDIIINYYQQDKKNGKYQETTIPTEESEEEEEHNELAFDSDPIYNKVVKDRLDWLDEHPGQKLGKRFWDKLTVDERIAVYIRKEKFVASFAGFAGMWLTPKYIERCYTEGLNRPQNKRSKERALKRMVKQQEYDAQKKVDEGEITENYYEIDPKKRPFITKDYKAIVTFAPEVLPLEALPPESLEKVKGFKKLSDFERVVLLQKMKDKRDGTNITADIIKETNVECNPDALFENFQKGKNFRTYKEIPHEIFGARGKGKE